LTAAAAGVVTVAVSAAADIAGAAEASAASGVEVVVRNSAGALSILYGQRALYNVADAVP
jgi:hypothetical protein